jgi:hypothetical protein
MQVGVALLGQPIVSLRMVAIISGSVSTSTDE